MREDTLVGLYCSSEPFSCAAAEQDCTLSIVIQIFNGLYDAGVTGRLCVSVAQWSECSHGMRGVLGSSPGRVMCFFLPCDISWPVWWANPRHSRYQSEKDTAASSDPFTTLYGSTSCGAK